MAAQELVATGAHTAFGGGHFTRQQAEGYAAHLRVWVAVVATQSTHDGAM